MIRDDSWSNPLLLPGSFVLLALLWGGSFVAIDVGLGSFPPVLFAAVRYAGAAVLLLGLVAATRERHRPRGRREWAAVALVGTFVVGGYNALLYLGAARVGGATTAVVVSLSPVLTAGFARLFGDRDPLGVVGGAGLLAGVAGVALVAGPAAPLSGGVVGVALVALGAASFALGSVLVRPLRGELPVAVMQAWGMLLGGGLLVAAGRLRGERLLDAAPTPTTLVALAYLVVGSSVVGYLIYFSLLARVGPTETNLIAYAEPVTAAVGSWLLLGEVVGMGALAGFALIATGFLLLKGGHLRRRARATLA